MKGIGARLAVEDDTSIAVHLVTADEANAQQLLGMVKGMVSQVTQGAEPEDREMLEKIAVAADGTAVNLTFSMSTAEVIQKMDEAAAEEEKMAVQNNMRDLYFAIRDYQFDEDEWPRTLDDLKNKTEVAEQMKEWMTNPQTGETPAYFYQRPSENFPSKPVPVLYIMTNGQKDESGPILYSDGAIRMPGDEVPGGDDDDAGMGEPDFGEPDFGGMD
jgi:hypothetical protein